MTFFVSWKAGGYPNPSARRLRLIGPAMRRLLVEPAVRSSASVLVRGFLSFLRAAEPETEVPDHKLLTGARRPNPYLFTPAQVAELMNEASRMKPTG